MQEVIRCLRLSQYTDIQRKTIDAVASNANERMIGKQTLKLTDKDIIQLLQQESSFSSRLVAVHACLESDIILMELGLFVGLKIASKRKSATLTLWLE